MRYKVSLKLFKIIQINKQPNVCTQLQLGKQQPPRNYLIAENNLIYAFLFELILLIVFFVSLPLNSLQSACQLPHTVSSPDYCLYCVVLSACTLGIYLSKFFLSIFIQYSKPYPCSSFTFLRYGVFLPGIKFSTI